MPKGPVINNMWGSWGGGGTKVKSSFTLTKGGRRAERQRFLGSLRALDP